MAPGWRSSAPRSELAPRTVDIWRIQLDPPRETRDDFALLSPDETARAARFKFDRHRRRFAVGRASLRRILAGYARTPAAAIRFVYGERGKPALDPARHRAHLRFNLSNSADLALCAVCLEHEVGVDLEAMRDNIDVDGVAERFFSEPELRVYRALPADERHPAFFRCWTRKEAYMKATGMGLFRSSTDFDVTLAPREPARLLAVREHADDANRWRLLDLDPGPGFAGALVAGRAFSEVVRFSLVP